MLACTDNNNNNNNNNNKKKSSQVHFSMLTTYLIAPYSNNWFIMPIFKVTPF